MLRGRWGQCEHSVWEEPRRAEIGPRPRLQWSSAELRGVLHWGVGQEYEEFEITSHLEREKMYNDLASAMSITVEHKEMISQQLKDLNEYCSGKTDLLQPLLARD